MGVVHYTHVFITAAPKVGGRALLDSVRTSEKVSLHYVFWALKQSCSEKLPVSCALSSASNPQNLNKQKKTTTKNQPRNLVNILRDLAVILPYNDDQTTILNLGLQVTTILLRTKN